VEIKYGFKKKKKAKRITMFGWEKTNTAVQVQWHFLKAEIRRKKKRFSDIV